MLKHRKEDRLLLIKTSFLHRIDFLLGKHNIKDEELYNIIKDFFKDYLNIHYEFTFEELVQELEKVYIDPNLKQEVLEFIEEVGLIEFSDNAYNQNKIKEFLESFAWLIIKLIPLKVKVQVFDKTLHSLIEQHKSDFDEERFLISEDVNAFKFLVKKASQELSRGDVGEAKRLYLKALAIYNNMSVKEKKNYFKLLTSLYNMLK